MNLKLLLISLCITQISFSQKKANDLNKMNLKGEISAIDITEIKMPSTMMEGGSLNSRKETNHYLFNKQGFIIEEKCSVNDQFYSKKRKDYNALNQISKVQEYQSEEVFDGTSFFEYEYDKNGKVSKLTYSGSPSYYRNQPEKKANTTVYTEYEIKEDKTEEKKLVTIEDVSGNILEQDSFIRNELYSKTENFYNKKGLLSKTSYSEFWNGRATVTVKEFEYNANNDAIKITSYDGQNNIQNKENISYKYDKKGNWIEKNATGEETITTKRKIEYKG